MPERPVDEKLSHQLVNFTRPSEIPGEQCYNCRHVIETLHEIRCEGVASPIYLEAWCDRWIEKHRLTARQAGYMELKAARKDGDCDKVDVRGGISSERGCCNEFKPEGEDVEQFKCGNCEHVEL